MRKKIDEKSRELQALRDLREGKNGVGQPAGVRRHLKALERAGWIRFTSGDGAGGGTWYLTQEGRDLIEDAAAAAGGAA